MRHRERQSEREKTVRVRKSQRCIKREEQKKDRGGGIQRERPVEVERV